MFKISAFGDEIADDLLEQVRVLNELQIGHLELRGVWGKNVLDLTNAETAEVKRICDAHGVGIASIGSPIGKSPLVDPAEKELANLARISQIAHQLGVTNVRVFSFYPPTSDAGADQFVAEAAQRLAQLVDAAAQHGVALMLENEKGIVGDTVARCQALMQAVARPALGFVWDPANFVQVGEARVTERGWPALGAYVTYVHVKDAVAGGGVRPAGQGDGQLRALLRALLQDEYTGFLALEPHLAIAGHSSGYSGPDGMAVAVQALRQIMAECGCEEAK
ncbi:MAG: sugar phosphate isomerase/epimerase [Caldilineaceae bacterium]|nr:sugar phosphate isomerase/epimerase [Caldilineaceae bacterium]MCB0144515.1 sugar phosphate isomerase/epimerase [Caldilineaceae bacterium]